MSVIGAHPGPSEFDKAHLSEIMSDRRGEYDWFSCHLFRLIEKADATNRERLRVVFPGHVAALEAWMRGDL